MRCHPSRTARYPASYLAWCGRYPAWIARQGFVPGTGTALRVAVALGWQARRAAQAVVRRSAARGDRGDVPGWVLVTLMTAGLVTALWVLARDRLTGVFDWAISSVTGQ